MKKKRKKNEKKISTFVRVEGPLETRKNILKAAIEATQILKSYERYRKLKQEKVKKIHELKVIMFDVEKLARRLKGHGLPIVERIEKELEKEKTIDKKPVVVKDKKVVSKVKHKPVRLTEEDKLESELRDIESKLRNLRV